MGPTDRGGKRLEVNNRIGREIEGCNKRTADTQSSGSRVGRLTGAGLGSGADQVEHSGFHTRGNTCDQIGTRLQSQVGGVTDDTGSGCAVLIW